MSIIKEIAAEAGVSVSTVYNVINGKHSKVSEKNIELINELISGIAEVHLCVFF